MKRSLMTLVMVSSAILIFAANEKRDVLQVAEAVTITEAIDYQITHRTEPFATAGSIDILNADAAVVFVNIKPSIVIDKYLDKITVNGVALQNNENCRVSIYRHGSIVMPHSDTKNPDGTEFYPLTVYTSDDCTGEATKYNGVKRHTSNTSFPFRSFTLKRGYMVTMANNTDGTGYSHCYIANTEDRTVQLRPELADKVGFFRIFRWQWPAKKGNSDLNSDAAIAAMNASWFYTWGAGENARTDSEFVPMRHHETGTDAAGEPMWAWPSFSEINECDNTCTHVLGQNEPDYVGIDGEVVTPVSELMKVAHEFLYSGMRIGTCATCNPNVNWTSDYVNRCREANIRVDFVATHLYIGGSSPKDCINSLRSLHTATGLPVWLTEWNNGANWTQEGGFNTDSEGWHSWIDRSSYNATDSRMNGVWLTDVLKRAEKEPWLERIAVYSGVEPCRELWVWDTGKTTPGGDLYATFESDFAYQDANEHFMTWNYKAPKDLSIEFKTTTKRATLTWSNENGKLTDSIFIERKIDNEDNTFVKIKKINPASPTIKTISYTDTLVGKTGVVTYRISNYDFDGKVRRSGEASLTIGNAQGNDFIQYGNITITNADKIQVEFDTPFPTPPSIFMGTASNKNGTVYPTNYISDVTQTKFFYQLLPLKYQEIGTNTLSKDENIDFMAMLPGNYTFGKMDIEVGDGKANSDTIEVKFKKPFPAGVTPAVLTELRPASSTNTYYTRVWDITNEGFKATALYEIGKGSTVRAGQPLHYAAFTPGSEVIDEENGIVLSAGISSTPIHGTTARLMYFTIPRTEDGIAVEDTLCFESPYAFTNLQTYNYPAGTIIRNFSDIEKEIDGVNYVEGMRIRRFTDSGATALNNKASADYAAWVTISTKETTPSGIGDVVVSKSENPLEVEVINRIVYVKGHDGFDLYTISGTKAAPNATQTPGIYIVRVGNKTAKIIVK